MMPACTLIVFAKAPQPGRVKTRLAAAIGAQGAARLAARMLDDTLRRAGTARVGPVELCCTPDQTHPQFQAAAVHGVRLTRQGDGDLGRRMQRALERALLETQQALLIGTDAPALGPDVLRQAAAALATHDAVCVPAHDGGYVLIGLRRPCPELFADIDWGSERVMQQTRARAAAAGLSLLELAPLQDIDQPEDLEHVPKEWLT
jgi:rSAM/selenodomain-associated transferase 1